MRLGVIADYVKNPVSPPLPVNWPRANNMGLPRGLSGLTNFLLLVDLRSGLGDAAFYEISLNLELLLRAQVHHGVEGQVAW